MGQIARSKLVVLIACFCAASLLIYSRGSSHVSKKPVRLKDALSEIPGWKLVDMLPLDSAILEGLKVDEYINAAYSNGKSTVSLYIGYYYTTKKVGAPHHPLVCFPGQGWVVTKRRKGSIPVGAANLNFSQMIVKRGDSKQLVVYWFQSYDQADAGTFSQKMSSFYNKFFRHGEDNAFVRITADLDKMSEKDSEGLAKSFIKAFYPAFLRYVKNEIPAPVTAEQ